MSLPALTGSCLCEGVQFRLHGELAPIQVCHCLQCRKAQGGPFATNIPVNKSGLTLTAGAELLKSYSASPGKRRWFCSVCGSPIYSERDSLPGVLRLRAGLINEALPLGVGFHAFVGSQCNWWPIADEHPQHEQAAPG